MNINLNQEIGIFISTFECGKTQNVEVKVGRRKYLCDFTKNSNNAQIDVYKKLNKDRKKFSKYDPKAEKYSISIKKDAVLRKKFFENIEEIEKAQKIINKWKEELYYI